MTALGLHCLTRPFSSCAEWGLFSSYGAWASHCGGFSGGGAWALGQQASVDAAHGLICPAARGIFPDQGLNLCPSHWQASSLPLDHQGSTSASSLSLCNGK